MIAIPPDLARSVGASPDGARWLRRVPSLIADCVERWGLTLGPPVEHDATASWVAPCTMTDGRPAYLKIGWPHMEARDEIAGLRHWAGRGMVGVIEAIPDDHAILLEACIPGERLRARPVDEQDAVIAEVLATLWTAPPGQFRPLREMTDYWCACAEGRVDQWEDADLIRAGLAELSALARDDTPQVVLHTDLHAGNVLSAQRTPWLAIDPKPFIGDPAYDATQHLLNNRPRLFIDARGITEAFCRRLGVNPHRVQRWLFARLAQEASLDPALLPLARAVRAEVN